MAREAAKNLSITKPPTTPHSDRAPAIISQPRGEQWKAVRVSKNARRQKCFLASRRDGDCEN